MIELFKRAGTPYFVEIDGCTVPNVEVFRSAPGEGNETALIGGELFSVCIDHRFASEYVTREELDRWLPLIAHAQAIGAGFSCHGPNSRRVNPFGVANVGLAAMPTDEPALCSVP